LAGAGAVELERQGDVLRRGQARDEVVVLEDEAHAPTPQLGEVARREVGQPVAGDGDGPARRSVEAARDVEQGRLARTARPHDGDEFAEVDVEADPGERDDRHVPVAVDARDVREDDVWCAHDWFPPVCVW
jgi:hypothetical protein